MQRRKLLVLLPASALAGCGFQLRQAPNFVFRTVHVTTNSPLVNELKRNLASSGAVQVVDAAAQAEVIVEILAEQKEKSVVGQTATGQVREFQLRYRLQFLVRTAAGKELIAPNEILQVRDISFNESAVLSKESEENLLYRDMQTDLVQQLLRRLAAIKAL